jgi:hypothetical protein
MPQPGRPFVCAALLALAACRESPLTPDPQLHLDRRPDRTVCRNQVVTGSVGSVYVPPGYNCTVTRATVSGDILGDRPGSVDVSESTLSGSIAVRDATGALSVRHSILTGGSIAAVGTPSVFISSTTLDRGSILVRKGSGSVSIQGDRNGFTALSEGEVVIERREGGSILLTSVAVDRGGVRLRQNLVTGTADVTRNSFAELQIRENQVTGARLAIDQNRVASDAEVSRNRGAGSKRVQLNVLGGTLRCLRNEPPFEGGPNTAQRAVGQCF